MIIIGVDFHPGSQQIASVDTDTGEFEEKRLAHREEAEKFYRDLASRGTQIRVGREASGYARWFERLLAELQIELWIGDAAEIERILAIRLLLAFALPSDLGGVPDPQLNVQFAQ